MFETAGDLLEVTDCLGSPLAPVPAAAEPDGRTAPSAVVQELVRAVEEAVAQEAWRQSGPEALADAQAMLALTEQVRVATLSRLAEVERRRLFLEDGAPTIGTWVDRQQTSLGRSDLALSRRLAHYPVLGRALRRGALCVTTAEVVGQALARCRRHVDRPDGLIDGLPGEQVIAGVVVDGVRMLVCEALGGLSEDDPRVTALVRDLDEIVAPVPLTSQLSRLEAAFVLLATLVEPAQLPGALGVLVDGVLPVQLEDRAEDAHVHRAFALRLKPDGSGWTITRGDLDLETGELLDTVIRAQLVVDEEAPTDTEAYAQLRTDGWRSGDELPACGGPRSRVQRQHDALRSALQVLLSSGALGLRDKVAPHIAVTVGLDALHDAPGALPPRAASGARLPRSLVRRWWCDSAVTRFVLGLGGRVLETSHTERTLKAHERRAVHVETGGRCLGAGCSGRGSPLVPHHVIPYALCGTTRRADTVLLCPQTHRELHRGTVLLLKDGRWIDELGWRDPPDQR